MTIVHVSYFNIRDHHDPESWLKRIDFFVKLLEQMAGVANVKSVHFAPFHSMIKRNEVDYHFIKNTFWGRIIPFARHRYIQSLNPDVVIVHGFHFPWQVLWLRRFLDKSVAIFIQHHSEVPLRHYKRHLQRMIDKGVTGYFFPAFEQAINWVLDGQIRTIRKVVEVMEVPSVFYPLDKNIARTKTGIKSGLIYLWVGRFDFNKDPMTLIRGFLKYAKENPAATLYVIFQSVELELEVNNILNDSGDLKRQVIMVGKISHDELLYWFNSADFIVSTSHNEGMGIAVCEAMSCGCIPILTNIPSFRSMTDNGAYGILYNAGQVDGLHDAFTKSAVVNVTSMRNFVLTQYRTKMSPEAITNKMLSAINLSRREV